MARRNLVVGMVVLVVVSCCVADGMAQRGRGPQGPGGGRGFRGGRGDAAFAADRDVFHFLLSHHDKIRRTVKNLDDGVETLTESDDRQIALKIQDHVPAMYRRIERRSPVRMWDSLFAEIFRHTNQIDMQIEKTDRGVKVRECSQDPYVVALIQEHARVVSKFVEHGFEEAHRNHAVPARDGDDAESQSAPTQRRQEELP